MEPYFQQQPRYQQPLRFDCLLCLRRLPNEQLNLGELVLCCDIEQRVCIDCLYKCRDGRLHRSTLSANPCRQCRRIFEEPELGWRCEQLQGQTPRGEQPKQQPTYHQQPYSHYPHYQASHCNPPYSNYRSPSYIPHASNYDEQRCKYPNRQSSNVFRFAQSTYMPHSFWTAYGEQAKPNMWRQQPQYNRYEVRPTYQERFPNNPYGNAPSGILNCYTATYPPKADSYPPLFSRSYREQVDAETPDDLCWEFEQLDIEVPEETDEQYQYRMNSRH